jgi:hypothetical protein
MPPKPKPHDAEVTRRVEEARPGAKAADPTFDAIIEAILDADSETVREHKQRRMRQRTDKVRRKAT